MKIKDKRTGKLIETEGCVVNGPGFTMSMEAFAEKFEIVPETEKPFEEVAKVGFETILGAPLKTTDKDEDLLCQAMERTIKIADRDYYKILPNGTKKTKFTWDEAMKIEKKTHGKWRLPTEQEWFAICAAFGKDEDGKITGKALAKNLNLTTDEDDYGFFWSRTANSKPNARSLYFDSSSVYPQSYGAKTRGFTVRCVKEVG